MRIPAAILVLFISFLTLAPGASAELVDHIVAAVNNEVITASELAQAAGLNERIGKSVLDRKTLETETLEGLITRRLLVQESRRLRFVEVSEQEIGAEVEKFRKHFESDAAFTDFLRSVDLTEQELRRMLGEQLLVEKFVEKKVGLFVRVTREVAQSYFDDHATQFPGKRFQDVQKTIMETLMDRMVGQQLDKYVAELRGKTDIRVNPS